LESSNEVTLKLNEDFYDKLNSYEHRLDFLRHGVEEILRVFGSECHENLDIKKLINELRVLNDDFKTIRDNLLPEGHSEECKCYCVACGESHNKSANNKNKCSAYGYCVFRTCC
jgi:hypothetical protein